MYSVPSFGGHIAISRDVTRYPILVIRRTAICVGDRGSYVLCSCRERKSPGGVISGKIPGIQPELVLSLLSCRNNRYT